MSITAILEEGRVANSKVSFSWDAFGMALFFPFSFCSFSKRRVMKQSEKQEVLEIIASSAQSCVCVFVMFESGLDLSVDGAALR